MNNRTFKRKFKQMIKEEMEKLLVKSAKDTSKEMKITEMKADLIIFAENEIAEWQKFIIDLKGNDLPIKSKSLPKDYLKNAKKVQKILEEEGRI